MQSRKLDFRVWDKEHSKFMVMDLDSELSITFNGHLMESYIDGYCLHNKDTYVIQQWTGLVDINDVKIYEDDIIHYDFDGDSYPEEAFDKNLICKYETNNGWYAFVEKDVIEDDGWCWLEVRNHCTVIGNIFENPELLN